MTTTSSQVLLTFLINACWQVAIVAAFASFSTWLLRNSAARYRHWVWVAALFLSLGIPLTTSVQSLTASFFNSSPTFAVTNTDIKPVLPFDRKTAVENEIPFAAVRNRALNLRQRQSIERDWEHDEAIADVRELHRPPEAADEILERADLRARLDAALESLPERCRLVMHLRWREQMRHAEIASVMGISVKGVEIQLARGLRAIRARVV